MNDELLASATLVSATDSDAAVFNIIRIETALSRYPIHRLAKRGDVRVEIRKKDGLKGLLWKVSYNSEYGQPGPLAYKLDTLVINRRIEEAGKPVPRVIRLGSLKDMATELGLDRNTNAVKHALLQNAFAAVTARITYKASDASERTLEAAFTRYSVVFTGELLPDGGKADSVCLVLNDIYMDVLNTAMVRPLDYEYLKELAPSSQRFYEILSYQIYAALRYDRPRARLLYSEYCLYSTQTRYADYDHVKKQMYKVHLPHLRSGYLAKVEYQPTTDEEGLADWEMFYTPGDKARAEYGTFTSKGRKALPPPKSRRAAGAGSSTPRSGITPPLGPPEPGEAGGGFSVAAEEPLVAELVALELNRSDAVRFVAERPEVCRRQIEGLRYLLASKRGAAFKTSQGAYLRDAIQQDYAPPAGLREQQRQQKDREAGLAGSARKAAQEAHRERYWANYVQYITQATQRLAEGEDGLFQRFLEQEEETRAKYTRLKLKTPLKLFDTQEARVERLVSFFKDDPAASLLDFWQWDRRQNPDGFRDDP